MFCLYFILKNYHTIMGMYGMIYWSIYLFYIMNNFKNTVIDNDWIFVNEESD